MNLSLFTGSWIFLPVIPWLMTVAAAADQVGERERLPAGLSAPEVPTPVGSWLQSEPRLAKADGDGGGGPTPVVVVSTAVDELDAVGTVGQGVSLREALRDVDAGGTVRFDPAVFTGASVAVNTISLRWGEFKLDKSFTVDASGLAAPVVIQANGASRHFSVYPNQAVVLKRLTLLGGNASLEPNLREGGALYNSGSLELTDCRLIGNKAGPYGGGIFCYAVGGNARVSLMRCLVEGNTALFIGAGMINWATNGYSATMTVEASTISGNVATSTGGTSGGGIMNYSTGGLAALTVQRSTLCGNQAGTGGGIMNSSNSANASCAVTLEQTTISGNTPINGQGTAAGLRSYVYSGNIVITLVNSILAGNLASSWDDLFVQGGTITSLGGNLIGVNPDVVAQGSDRFGDEELPLAPLLAPLGDYGGATPTMALLPGSVARNVGVPQGAGPVTDQRGYAIQGVPDAGAYEAGNLQNFAGWIREQLPLGTGEAQYAAGVDFDGDGASNQDEWLTDTQATNAGSFFQPSSTPVAGGLQIQFRSVPGRNYTLMASETPGVGEWAAAGPTVVGNGQELSFMVPTAGATRRFFRVDVGR